MCAAGNLGVVCAFFSPGRVSTLHTYLYDELFHDASRHHVQAVSVDSAVRQPWGPRTHRSEHHSPRDFDPFSLALGHEAGESY